MNFTKAFVPTLALALSAALFPSAVLPRAVAQMAPPMVKAHIYDETTDPHALVQAGLQQARREHKRVIVDFGGDWCGDCQVLDIYFKQSPNRELMEKHFVLVHVYIGHIDKNLDIPTGYGINIKKGVPALAVLNANGKVVYSQATGEFENMRNMKGESVTEFLNKWKA